VAWLWIPSVRMTFVASGTRASLAPDVRPYKVTSVMQHEHDAINQQKTGTATATAKYVIVVLELAESLMKERRAYHAAGLLRVPATPGSVRVGIGGGAWR